MKILTIKEVMELHEKLYTKIWATVLLCNTNSEQGAKQLELLRDAADLERKTYVALRDLRDL